MAKGLFFPGFKVVLEGVRSALKTVQRYNDQLKQLLENHKQTVNSQIFRDDINSMAEIFNPNYHQNL